MRKIKSFSFNPSSVIQLFGVFLGTAFFMTSYEVTKQELYSKTLTLWQSHTITIIVTYILATIAAFFMRKWAVGEADVRIAATAFDMQDGLMVTDAGNVILRVNRAFTDITGYTAEEAVGQTPRLLSSGKHDVGFYRKLWEAILQTGIWNGEIWNCRKNGDVFPVYLSITAVKNSHGKTSHYVASMHDITRRLQNEEQIRQLAFYDPMTQLPNRRLLNDRMVQTLSTSKRSAIYGALIFLDLDNFKSLNDTHGHGAGDLLLIEAAKRITSCLREVDTVSRFGGDEFVVLLNQLAKDKDESIELAGKIAEKIRIALFEPYFLSIPHQENSEMVIEYYSGARIGVVLFIDHGASVEEIIKSEDIAMYQAKKAGRNLVRFFDQAA